MVSLPECHTHLNHLVPTMTTTLILGSRYHKGREIGRGSFSVVYEGFDTVTKQPVAVKALEYRGGRERLLRIQHEVSVLAALDHPHIVKTFALSEDAGTYYLIMELLEGLTLRQHLSGGALSAAQAVSLLIQVAEALRHVHQEGIVHRDLKPSNIMVLRSEGTVSAKVLDFGLAWTASLASRYASPAVVGSLPYMSPEQTGVLHMPTDSRADLYSLGIILYEMLTGQVPFRGTDVATLIHQHLGKIPPGPRTLNPGIPRLLDEITLRLLAKDPRERYQTAAGLLVDLGECSRVMSGGAASPDFTIGKADRVKEVIAFRTHVVGRATEFITLREALERAAEGKGEALLLCGEPGVGKTRLINELRSPVSERGGLFISGKCTEYTRAFPYAPFVEAIEEYVQMVQNLPAAKRADVEARLSARLGPLSAEVAKIVPEIRTLTGPVDALPSSPWEQEKDLERFLTVTSDFLVQMGDTSLPIVLFLDDLQWLDRGSLQLLERTIPKLAGSSVLVVGAYRDTEVREGHPLHGLIRIWKTFLKEIKLAVLAVSDVVTIVADLLHMDELHARDLAMTLHGRTAGNPFFTFELLKALIEMRGLVQVEGQWMVDHEQLGLVSSPTRVDQVILSRLAQFAPANLEILGYAAVIGRHFGFEDILHLADREPAAILACIDDAIRHCLLIPRAGPAGEPGYSFAHDKILEALYARLDPAQKASLHQKVADALERRFESRVHEVIFDLALHCIRGLDRPKALRYAYAAGHVAKSTYANAEAAYFFETVLALLAQGIRPDGEGTPMVADEVKEQLADVYVLLGRYDAATRLYAQLLPQLTDQLVISRMHTKMGAVYFKQGNKERTIEHFTQGLASLGIRQSKTLPGVLLSAIKETVIQCAHTYGPRLFVKPLTSPDPFFVQMEPPPGQGDSSSPRTPRARRQEDIRVLNPALRLFQLLVQYFYFIDMKYSIQLHLKQLNLAERTGSGELMRIAYSMHALICNAIGMHRRARRYAERSMALNEEQRRDRAGFGSASRVLHERGTGLSDNSLVSLGRTYYYSGEHDEAIRIFTRAADETMKTGDLWEAEVALGHLCLAYFAKGQFGTIIDNANRLLSIADGVNDIRGKGWGQVLLAIGNLHLGDLDRALHHGDLAVQHNQTAGDQLITAMSLRVLGQTYLRAGDLTKALSTLERSRLVIEQHQLLHEFVTGTYVLLAEAYICAARAIEPARTLLLAKAGRFLRVAGLLAKLFRNWAAHYTRIRACYELERGRTTRAVRRLDQSIAIATELGADYELARGWVELGKRLQSEHDEKGRAYLERARQSFARFDARIDLQEVQQLLGLPQDPAVAGPAIDATDKLAVTTTRKLESLLDICQETSAVLDLEQLLGRILQSAIAVVGAERGFLLLYEDASLKVKMAHRLVEEDIRSETFKFSRSVIGEVERTKRPVLTTDAQADPKFQLQESIHRYNLRSILCVPLLRGEQLLGVLYVDNRLVANLFSSQDLSLMVAFGAQAAIAIENASTYGTLRQLTETLEQRIHARTEELQTANQRLQEMDRRKSSMVSEVSHELRTPLTSIKGYIENMLDGMAGDLSDKQVQYLTRIKVNLNRLNRMITDLLDLSRIEEGKVELHLAPVPLAEVIADVVESVRLDAQEKSIAVRKTDGKSLPPARCDRDKVQRILENLVQNALKFTPCGGSVSVELEAADPGMLQLSVRDTGCGIDSQELDKVFEKFYRSRSASRGVVGAGLGLPIVRSLVQLHGGRIWVESTVGKGSRFTFTLPTWEGV